MYNHSVISVEIFLVIENPSQSLALRTKLLILTDFQIMSQIQICQRCRYTLYYLLSIGIFQFFRYIISFHTLYVNEVAEKDVIESRLLMLFRLCYIKERWREIWEQNEFYNKLRRRQVLKEKNNNIKRSTEFKIM